MKLRRSAVPPLHRPSVDSSACAVAIGPTAAAIANASKVRRMGGFYPRLPSVATSQKETVGDETVEDLGVVRRLGTLHARFGEERVAGGAAVRAL